VIGALLEMPRQRKEADDLPPSFGRRLRNLRKQHDMTQEQIAARLGLSVDGYRHWEHGRSAGLLLHLQSTAQAFGLTIPELLTELGFVEPDDLKSGVGENLDDLSLPLWHRWLYREYPSDVAMTVVRLLEGADRYSEDEARWIADTVQRSLEMIRRRPGRTDD
jgi:transcriptional regulator with XRE-family HTH domain